MMKAVGTRSYGVARQIGFSLVELMVSIVIGLIILAGVIQVVFTSKTTFLHQEEMSYIQENARYAMSVIGKDLQNAGYWGCAGSAPIAAVVASVDADTDAALMMGVGAINGYKGGGATEFPSGGVLWSAEADSGTAVDDNPDSFIVRFAEGLPIAITNNNSSKLTLESAMTVNAGGFVTVIGEDCQKIGVIGVEAGGTSLDYSTRVCNSAIKPGAADASYSCADDTVRVVTPYQVGSFAMNYTSHAYFVSESDVLTDQPALKRLFITQAGADETEEIALGVEDMSLLYAVKQGTSVQLKEADDVSDIEWAQVSAVQVSLLLRSRSPMLPEAVTKEYLDNDYSDRYMRQVVTSTFKLRNRI